MQFTGNKNEEKQTPVTVYHESDMSQATVTIVSHYATVYRKENQKRGDRHNRRGRRRDACFSTTS